MSPSTTQVCVQHSVEHTVRKLAWACLTYGEILDRNGHRLSPPNTNIVDRLQMPLDAGDGGPTNGIGNWQKAISSNLEPWQRYYRKLSLGTNLFPVAPQPQSPAADVLLALSKYNSTIEELRGRRPCPPRGSRSITTARSLSRFCCRTWHP